MTKWKKYTRDIWNTTKYYYEKAQKAYSGKVTNNIYAHPILVNPGVANEVFDLPSGVRLRVNSKERFWFNYSSQVQKSSIVNLQPAEVFIEQIDGS